MEQARVLFVTMALLAAGCVSQREPPHPSTGSPATSLPPVATPTGASAASGSVKLTSLVEGLTGPVFVTSANDGSGRLFIVEQAGRILVHMGGSLLATPFLDIRPLVVSGGERGLLSVAFHPDYRSNGVFIVYYTRASSTAADLGDIVVARYHVSSVPDVADPNSAQVLLTIDHETFANHNGGLALFGPDGYLYLGIGDGGFQQDPRNNGQSTQVLLGKLLRIKVGATGAYEIPPDNPSLGLGARPEIWAYGLRNPWRFSFDALTRDLYIGDVGQDNFEEIDVQPADSRGGENYGWSVYEGTHLNKPGVVLQHTPPVAEYSHERGDCSVTGGHVYRGADVPTLRGFYVLGDYCTGRIWTLSHVGGAWTVSPLLETNLSIASFGVDERNELYVVDLSGGVYRFDRA